MIKLKCNIDKYHISHFPNLNRLGFLPRVNDQIQVSNIYVEYYRSQKLPALLTVVSAIFKDDIVIVELHFGKLQLEAMRIAGINPYK